MRSLPSVSTELSETAGLLHEAILLMLEEEELRSTERELRSRLAAERSEIGRLRDTIQEMETLYKYRCDIETGRHRIRNVGLLCGTISDMFSA